MDITPSPRLLQMLGEIEFEEWQCIAELVDNSFDNFLELHRSGKPWAGGFVCNVTLPEPGVALEDAEVVVEDTGSGMAKSQLQNAVRAGFSSNDRYTKLGLFGMGFNVATARLGTNTSVLTTTSEDSLWSGVEINFSKLRSDFDAPEISEPKDFMSEHGTRITISNLKPERYQYLRQQHSLLRNILGKVYGFLLSEYPFELFVQGEKVTPVKHCVWDGSRSIKFKIAGAQTDVAARQEIDFPLAPVVTCQDCDTTQPVDADYIPDKCEACDSTNVAKRNRRIWGWIGIQRYLDQKNYGIDFLRNGRKILLSNRSLFEWKNPEDPASSAILEYPSNLAHQGGRIVGEIHIDHVPVTYAKDAFEYSDKSWRYMIQRLRGDGPILPQRAKSLGYQENETPLALLARAYARTDAGTGCLIPGDGKQAIHQTSRAWGLKFAEGDPEYQTDRKWWDAAVEHDTKTQAPVAPQPAPTPPPSSDDDIWEDEKPDGDDSVAPEPAPTPPPVVESVEQQHVRLLSIASKLHSLSGQVNSPLTDQKAKIETFEVRQGGRMKDASGNTTAIWLQRGKGNDYKAILDSDHPIFQRLRRNLSEVLAEEIARQFIVISSSLKPFTQVLTELVEKNAMFLETLTTSSKARAEAEEICNVVRGLLVSKSKKFEAKLISALSVLDQHAITDSMVSKNGVAEKIEDLTALEYAPPITILRLFASVPAAFMDDLVFKRSFAELENLDLQFKSQALIHAPLIDVVLATSGQNNMSADDAEHVRRSVSFLSSSLSTS
jgi:hypothetical protein